MNQRLEFFLLDLNFSGCFSSTFKSALICLSRICSRLLSTPLCDCSEETELIRGMNSPVQQVNVFIPSIEMDSVSITSSFQYSTTQWTYSLEYWVSRIREIFHHL